MVGIVIVSHSKHLAYGVLEFIREMAGTAPVVAVGGLGDGTFGTSYERIREGILEADEGDGVLVIMDIGSSVMLTEMVIENLEGVRVEMADCPMVEGALAAAVTAEGGVSLEEVKADAEEARGAHKML